METFIKVSSKPSICYLDPISLTPDRLDASYYAPEFLEVANEIEKSPLQARSLASISAKLNCGATPKLVIYKEDGLPLIRTSNVRPNFYNEEDVLFVQGRSLSSSSNLAILPNDVLYTMSGTIGYAAVYPQSGRIASFSNTIARARIEEGDPYYVALFLNSRLGMSQSMRFVSGGVLAHVMPTSVKKLRVLSPNVKVQQAIGNKVRKAERLRELAEAALTEAFNSLDQAMGFVPMKSHGRSAWAQSRDFGVSRFDAEYYQPHYLHMDRHLEAWRASRKPISTLRSLMKSGSYGVLPSSDDYGQGDLRFLRAQDVGAFLIEDKEEVLVPRHYANPKAMTREGDLLLEVKGEIAGGAICPKAFEGCLVNGSLYRMTLKEDVDAFYVLALLLSPIGVLQKKRAAANSVISYLSIDFLYDLLIPRLSSEEESNIGQLLRSYTEKVYQARSAIQQAKADVEALISNTLDLDALHAESAAIESWLAANPSQFASAN